MQHIVHKHIENVLLRLRTTFKVQQRLLRTKNSSASSTHFIVPIFLFLNLRQISHGLFLGIGVDDGFELVVGDWWLVVGGGWQWLAVGGRSPLAVGGGWWLAVGGGWWSLGAVLKGGP